MYNKNWTIDFYKAPEGGQWANIQRRCKFCVQSPHLYKPGNLTCRAHKNAFLSIIEMEPQINTKPVYRGVATEG